MYPANFPGRKNDRRKRALARFKAHPSGNGPESEPERCKLSKPGTLNGRPWQLRLSLTTSPGASDQRSFVRGGYERIKPCCAAGDQK